MSKRLVLVLVALGVVGLLGYAYASPYLTVERVRAAAERGDADTVSAHVDYPALRESLKGWVSASMAKWMATRGELRDNPLGLFGMALALKLGEVMVEGMVTPEAVRMFLQGERPTPSVPGAPQPQPEAGGAPAARPVETTMRYEGWDRFVVTARSVERPKDEVSTVWQRQGLTWRLVAVRLPTPE